MSAHQPFQREADRIRHSLTANEGNGERRTLSQPLPHFMYVMKRHVCIYASVSDDEALASICPEWLQWCELARVFGLRVEGHICGICRRPQLPPPLPLFGSVRAGVISVEA